jgi:hypothetical protein
MERTVDTILMVQSCEKNGSRTSSELKFQERDLQDDTEQDYLY